MCRSELEAVTRPGLTQTGTSLASNSPHPPLEALRADNHIKYNENAKQTPCKILDITAPLPHSGAKVISVPPFNIIKGHSSCAGSRPAPTFCNTDFHRIPHFRYGSALDPSQIPISAKQDPTGKIMRQPRLRSHKLRRRLRKAHTGPAPVVGRPGAMGNAACGLAIGRTSSRRSLPLAKLTPARKWRRAWTASDC